MLASVLFGCFLGMTVVTWLGLTQEIDDIIRIYAYSVRTDSLTAFMKCFTFLGQPKTIIAVIAVLVVLPGTRSFLGIPLTVGAGINEIIKFLLKRIIRRPRPDKTMFLVKQGGFSYPSGHANGSMVVYGYFAYKLLTGKSPGLKALGILAAILPFLIGISRVYLGVHYASDVLAGWLLGGTMLTLMIMVDRSRQAGENPGTGIQGQKQEPEEKEEIQR